MARTNRSTAFLALPLAALAAACSEQEAPTEKSADPVDVAEEISALEGRWSRDYASSNGAKIAAYYADDATVMQPGSPPLTGGQAIGAAVAEVTKDQNFSIEFKNERIDVAESGDLAYARGRYTQQATNPDTKQIETSTGNYLTVYRKQPDGSWKAVEDISTQ